MSLPDYSPDNLTSPPTSTTLTSPPDSPQQATIIRTKPWSKRKGRALDDIKKLFRATRLNQSRAVQRILETGIDPDVLSEEKTTALKEACICGNLDVVRILLRYGALPEAVDENGKMAVEYATEKSVVDLIEYFVGRKSRRKGVLHIAAAQGDLWQVKKFIEEENMDVDLVDECGTTPLHEACFHGQLNVVDYLLDRNASITKRCEEKGYSPLHNSVLLSSENVLRKLLEFGADIQATDLNGNTSFSLASPHIYEIFKEFDEDLPEIEKPQRKKKLNSLSSEYTNSGLTREERKLLQMIASYEKVAVYSSKRKRHSEEIFQEEKPSRLSRTPKKPKEEEKDEFNFEPNTPVISSNENSKPLDVHFKDKTGRTLLHKYCLKGNLKKVKELLSNGANVNAVCNASYTPLHDACVNGSLEIVTALLAQDNINVNIQSIYKETPLHDAVENGFFDIVKILLEHNANPNILNEDDETVLDICNSRKIQKLLESFGAKNSDGKELIPKTKVLSNLKKYSLHGYEIEGSGVCFEKDVLYLVVVSAEIQIV
ncbi:hypothetical protein O9G_003508 [Rozella allomycis CSF55]|uniref:Uncharacterized protein n=1 Tax=Rozella allomycis (strain CSF55) TaxID=988480 RepID=A0A075APJ6_ROZAC|nr:hypothetical protein O9G_003508 [Rozella allomycis CSF55]|eukprot:EPZ32044.1 hypothetical protein O9G_003508 [Rozella allomycis CSF55]